MEIINVEARVFERLLESMEEATKKVELLCNRYSDKALSQWLDNQDVCLLLQISPRTLQSMRDSGAVAYTQVNRKMYYKPQDIEKLLLVVQEKRKENYLKQKKH